jgi:pimeloyl-ACP methyl ester carboxylesterase
LGADARPDLVKAIVAMEPSGPPVHDNLTKGPPDWFEDGPFTKPYGLTAAPLTYDPPLSSPGDLAFVKQAMPDAPDRVRCWEQAEPARKLAKLQDLPVLVVEAEASYHAPFDHCTARYLKQAGVTKTTYVRLAELGIHGNAHMLMLESNNHEIAEVARQWLESNGL